MVQQRGQFTKNIGKFARMQNRQVGSDSDEGSESEEEEDEEQQHAMPHNGIDLEEDDDEYQDNEGDYAAADGEVDQGEEDEEEDEEDEDAELLSSKKRKQSSFIDEAADEDEEEDEEEEDEEDEEEEQDAPRAGKKAKRPRFNLVDDEADVDEDEDDDEDDEDAADLINDEEEEAKAAAIENRSMHARMTNMREQSDALQNDEDIERFIQERYGQRSAVEEDLSEGTEVEQQAMLPTVKDPKLWIVKCRPGAEREVCVQLMQKFLDRAAAGQPLQIKSALAQDHVKGFIYVEAEKQSHVNAAVRGLRNIFGFKGSKLIPIGEMTEVMTSTSTAKSILKPSTREENTYVRIRNGLYKGDLAQVLEVSYAENQAQVKLLPRLDLHLIKEKHDGTASNSKHRPRPAPRLFSKQEAKDVGLAQYIQLRKLDRNSGKYFDYLDQHRFQDGYLVKSVSIQSCQVEESPTFDELQRFHATGNDDEGGDSTSLNKELAKLSKQVAQSSDVRYSPGDTVIVTDGDLKNLLGVVDRLDADGQVVIQPKLKDFKELIRFPVAQLNKFFKRGDHVKVTAGQHDGDTGMVVHVEDGVATLFTDITQEEAKVFTKDLVECMDEATGQTSFGMYELHDLVALDPTTVGIIVKVEREACRVLSNAGTPERPDVRTCKLPDLKRKLTSRHNTAQDMNMNPVSANDIVNIQEGSLKGKQCTVHHVHRGFLFGRCREVMEFGGIICVRARGCSVHGGKASEPAPQHRAGGFSYPQSPAHGLHDPMQPQRSPMSSPSRHGGSSAPQGGRGAFSGNARAPRRDDSLVGSVIRVKTGPWRGYKGKVTDATDTTVRLELEAMMKTVTVPKVQLALTPAQMGPPPGSRAGGRGASPYGLVRSPYDVGPQLGSATPMRGMPTPMRGDQTPMHDSMRTPMRESAWNPANATPAHQPAWQEEGDDMPGAMQGGTPGNYSGGGGGAGTPGAYTPYDSYSNSPATPGGGDDSHAGTPSGYSGGTPSYSNQGGTPTDHGARRDVYTPTDVHTPYSPSYTPTSLPATPSSPGASSPSTDMDASSRHATRASSDVWAVPGLVVHTMNMDAGVIRSVSPDGTCKVEVGPLVDGRLAQVLKEVTVKYSDLQMYPPVKMDMVRVVRGEDRGLEGTLVTEHETDCVIKPKDSDKMKVIDVSNLCKIVKD